MGIRFATADGRQGTLDVAVYAKEQFGPDTELVGVKEGIVNAKDGNGEMHQFALGHWAQENQCKVVYMEGFNTPETALDMPPVGLNYFDQSVFYNDGKDMEALKSMYPNATETSDGRTVVLDSDGLWRTMWSPSVRAPDKPLTHDQMVHQNLVNDPRLVMRTAGVVFFLALGGIEAEQDEKGFKVKDIVKALHVIARNAPHENKYQIGKLLNQTTGLEEFKFLNCLLSPEDAGFWLKQAAGCSSFQFRMMQQQMAEKVVAGIRSIALNQFQMAMEPLLKLEEAKSIRINLADIMSEFVSFLVGLDLLRDISRSTGLNEWISLSEDAAYDPSKLPLMPAFVGAFVQFLRVVMPITQNPALMFAKGKGGFKGIIHILNMIDECIYSLAGVPDSSAKYKMFMALKKVQAAIETKLSFHFQPDPLKDRRQVSENPFMQAKEKYLDHRETLYKICQLPRESWNNTFLDMLRTKDNLEVYYDSLTQAQMKIMKSFACMDAAYDMQPWIDVEHAERTHDAFSQYQESFGMTPPEAGYLAKNSPRAVENIAQALVAGAAYVSAEKSTNALLRNPYLLAQMIKTLMVASVNAEIGVVEVLNKFGISGEEDTYGSPDAARIWEDPDVVQKDKEDQIKEVMGGLAMEQSMQQQRSEARGMAQDQQGEEEGEPPKGGQGPAGPPMRATQMRGAA